VLYCVSKIVPEKDAQLRAFFFFRELTEVISLVKPLQSETCCRCTIMIFGRSENHLSLFFLLLDPSLSLCVSCPPVWLLQLTHLRMRKLVLKGEKQRAEIGLDQKCCYQKVGHFFNLSAHPSCPLSPRFQREEKKSNRLLLIIFMRVSRKRKK